MDEIRLLILDDDEEVIQSFEKTITRINRDQDNKLKYKSYTAKIWMMQEK